MFGGVPKQVRHDLGGGKNTKIEMTIKCHSHQKSVIHLLNSVRLFNAVLKWQARIGY